MFETFFFSESTAQFIEWINLEKTRMLTFLKAKLDKLDGQKNEQSKITKHLSLTKSINENFV